MSQDKMMDQSKTPEGPQRSSGERSEPERSGGPSGVARRGAASTEVRERPLRRHFGADYKLRILTETDQLAGTGEIGALLRREGLYSSHLSKWRRERAAGAQEALSPRKRGPKVQKPNPLALDVERLSKENAWLSKKLKKAEAIIDFQKKVAALLEMEESSTTDTDESAS